MFKLYFSCEKFFYRDFYSFLYNIQGFQNLMIRFSVLRRPENASGSGDNREGQQLWIKKKKHQTYILQKVRWLTKHKILITRRERNSSNQILGFRSRDRNKYWVSESVNQFLGVEKQFEPIRVQEIGHVMGRSSRR